MEHYGNAARDLHIVQPALTRQIKQLEDELGVELFERLPRGVRLTEPGKVLLERCRAIMDEIDKAITATRLTAEGKRGFIRIGFADGTIYSGLVPSIIADFRKRSPDVELELIPASSVNQASMLSENKIDLGFVYWVPENSPWVKHLDVSREKVLLAVAKSNKLSNKKSIHLKDLEGLPFIWFRRSYAPRYYDLMIDACQRAGVSLNVVQEAFTESTMLSLVAADIGLTFMTESARERKPNNVVLFDVVDLDATITLRAIWREADQNPALINFVRQLSSSN